MFYEILFKNKDLQTELKALQLLYKIKYPVPD